MNCEYHMLNFSLRDWACMSTFPASTKVGPEGDHLFQRRICQVDAEEINNVRI